MADPVTWLTVGSTLLSAGTAVAGGLQARNEGIAQNYAYQSKAQQENINAGQERAAAQRKAMAEDRKGTLLNSRAQAVAAASGGGALDPTIINIEGNIAGDAKYNSLTQLYEGESAARTLENGATTDAWAGKNAQAQGKTAMMSGFMKAGGTLLSAGSSLYSKYGAPGPSGGEFDYGDIYGNDDAYANSDEGLMAGALYGG